MNVDLSHAHLRRDARIAMLLDAVQMPDFTPSGRIYYDLLESIVSQQLSVKAATTIFNRFCTLFPDNYPHPELLVEVEVARLREMGLSYQKAGYLQNVARFSLENDLENHGWNQMSDEEIIDFLTQIKGVGKWTVQMLLMFTLGRPDVFPIDDLGIQQAMIKLYEINETGKELRKKMLELSAPWQPWRTVACRYLWRWKDATKTT
ncbi:MAG: DNA-3-methyladenine glycosylase 2 family protein [Saprospiraceae bacterium]|nr:DNA-3-methyladenine glycosylase 2 family protein [Saprospiraceae bacterium]